MKIESQFYDKVDTEIYQQQQQKKWRISIFNMFDRDFQEKWPHL